MNALGAAVVDENGIVEWDAGYAVNVLD